MAPLAAFVLLIVLCSPLAHGSPVFIDGQIASVLDYLNSNPDRQYNYNFAYLLDAQRKTDDVTSLTLELTGECFAYAGCPDDVFVCTAFVEHFSSSNHFVTLPDVNCKRKHEDEMIESTVSPSKSSYCPGCTVELNVNVPGVETLIVTALQHLNSEQATSKPTLTARVLRLQREIVSGVKFILLLEVADVDKTDSRICRIEYVQKPWISNEKHIVANNCTHLQDFHAVSAKKERSEVDNEIDVNSEHKMAADMQDGLPDGPNFDKMAETGNLEETSDVKAAKLADIEAQVIPATRFNDDSGQMVIEDLPELQSTMSSRTSSEESNEEQDKDVAIAREKRTVKDDSSDSKSSSEETKHEETAPQIRRKRSTNDDDEDDDKEKYRKHKKVKSCNKDDDSDDDDDDDDDDNDCPNKKKKQKKQLKCRNQDNDDDDDDDDDDDNDKCSKKKKKKSKKDSSSSSSSSSSEEDTHKRRRRDVDGKSERRFVAHLAEFAAGQLDNAKTKHDVLDVLRVKKIELEGAVYHLVIRFATRKCENSNECYANGADQLCKVQIHASRDRNSLRMLKSRCHDIDREADKNRARRSVPGAPTDVDENDATINKLAQQSLVQLDAQSSHANKLKIVKVLEAKKQVVAGMLYNIKVALKESDCLKTSDKEAALCGEKENGVNQICHIRIWDRPWLPNGRETNITCDDPKKTKRAIDDEYEQVTLQQFEQFTQTYNKTYDSPETQRYRFAVFAENLKKAKLLQTHEQGSAIYGASRFADLTEDEFKRTHLGYRPDLRSANEVPFPSARIPNIDIPTEFDWRTKNAVTKVKDQGGCGSCWAFSVTGNVEGQYAIQHGELIEFSEQELVDCDTSDSGCDGGLMDTAYRAIEKLGGLEKEGDYPYDAEDEKCTMQKSKVVAKLSGAVNISQNEDEMAKWLVKNGPIAIAINANAMQLYMGGVSHPLKFLCSAKSLDHGVLIVGYGVHEYKLFKKTLPYWIVKNSWGPGWGEQGYYRVYRGDGTCGLNQTPSSSIVV